MALAYSDQPALGSLHVANLRADLHHGVQQRERWLDLFADGPRHQALSPRDLLLLRADVHQRAVGDGSRLDALLLHFGEAGIHTLPIPATGMARQKLSVYRQVRLCTRLPHLHEQLFSSIYPAAILRVGACQEEGTETPRVQSNAILTHPGEAFLGALRVARAHVGVEQRGVRLRIGSKAHRRDSIQPALGSHCLLRGRAS
mmetsp:Transcript_32703/g.88596  ORF Transcript_32703/g.88596 Transcript_32703/m.88596 type:complete len:201 (-) Transcript_32703:183-785(-)